MLYEHLRPRFFWRGMWGDCLEAAACSPARQKEMARFLSPPYLHTTERGAEPFRIWAVDTIVGLTPAAPDGSQWVMVAVDPFTRWVEVGRIPTLSAHDTATWFHENITCRFGLPCMVRTDRGSEYRGEFDQYMQANGVQHRLISTEHPRANGLVER